MDALAFGFVPKHIVDDLQDIGNWKSRASAIDSLQKALRDVSDKSQLLPGLQRFVAFLTALVADPNFKIATSSVQILGDLVSKVGRDIEPYLKSILPSLVEKFTDSKILVRTANLKLLKRLMGVSPPALVLELLGRGMTHQSWKVREEIINTAIMATLQQARDSADHAAVFQLLAQGMSDGKERVRAVSLEGMAALAQSVGHAQLQSMAAASHLTDSQRHQVNQRIQRGGTPTANADGIVQHAMDAVDGYDSGPPDLVPSAASRGSVVLSTAATAASGTASRLPWEATGPRPRARQALEPWLDGGGSTGAAGATTGAGAGADTPSRQRYVQPEDSAKGGAGEHRSGGAVGTRSRSGRHQVAQPGSWLDSHASDGPPGLISVTSNSNGSVQGSGYNVPSSSRPQPQSYSNGSVTSQAHQTLWPPGWSPTQPLRSSDSHAQQYLPQGGPAAGSLSAHQNGSSAGPPHHLSPIHLRRQLTNGSDSKAGDGGTGLIKDYTSNGISVGHNQYNYNSSSAFNQPSQSDLHYSSPSNSSVNTPSAHQPASLSHLKQLRSEANSPIITTRGSPDVSGDIDTGPSPLTPSKAYNPGLGLWLTTALENDSPGASRQETFSPSKGELLANLKKRQIEKRANSAQVPFRPGVDEPLRNTESPQPTTPDSASHLGHYGLSPFAAGRPRLFSGLDGQLGVASPKAVQVTSVGATGMTPPRVLQESSSMGSQQGSYLQGVASGEDLQGPGQPAPAGAGGGAPGTPLGFLAARRARGGPLGTPPLPVDPGGNGGSYSQQYRDREGSQTSSILSSATTSHHLAPGSQQASQYQYPVANGIQNGSPSSKVTALSRLSPQLRARSADVAPTGMHAQPGTPTSQYGSGADSVLASPASLKPGSASQATSFWEKGSRPLEELTTAELTPLKDPEKACRAAITKMMEANTADRKTMDWQGQYEALNDVRRVLKHNPEVVRACLHDVVRGAAPAVDQLRSLCIKNSLNLLQELFTTLGRTMDRELDEVVPVLLKKAGDMSTAGRENWLAQEADRVLGEMCRTCGEHRVIAALCACAGHKSMHVRAKVASHLDGLLEMHTGLVRNLTTSNMQSLEKLFRTAAGFLEEGALEARVYGKRIIWGVRTGLGNKQEFERLAAIVQPEYLAKKVLDTVETSNGPPAPPSRNGASRGGLSRQYSGGSDNQRTSPGSSGYTAGGGVLQGVLSGGAYSSGSAASSEPPRRLGSQQSWKGRELHEQQSGGLQRRTSGSLGRQGSVGVPGDGGRGGSGGLGANDADTLTKAHQLLSGKDFRERLDGLKLVEQLAGSALSTASETQLVSLLDSLTARISDGNAKVAGATLDTLQCVFRAVRDKVGPGLSGLVPGLAAALGSSNEKVRMAAADATDCLLTTCDSALLIQHFSHCVSSGSLRGKPLLVERLQSLLRSLWPARPQLVSKHGVPAAFSLLNDMRGDSKAAASALLGTLAELMGSNLMDHALSLQPAMQQRVADAVAAATGRC